jgi:hypothetical protein
VLVALFGPHAIMMAMTFGLILSRMLFERVLPARMKSGMDVLCTASPFKNTFARSCIQYCGVARQLAIEILR